MSPVCPHPLSNELQIPELSPSVFANQLTDLGNGVYCTLPEGFGLPVGIYNITTDTLDSTFYAAEPGCLALHLPPELWLPSQER